MENDRFVLFFFPSLSPVASVFFSFSVSPVATLLLHDQPPRARPAFPSHRAALPQLWPRPPVARRRPPACRRGLILLSDPLPRRPSLHASPLPDPGEPRAASAPAALGRSRCSPARPSRAPRPSRPRPRSAPPHAPWSWPHSVWQRLAVAAPGVAAPGVASSGCGHAHRGCA